MLYFAQGSALLTEKEFAKNDATIEGFYSALANDQTPDGIVFPSGNLSVENVLNNGLTGEPEPVPFSPIGPGKPLTIMITEVYTGKNPHGFLVHKKDMLVTSAVKSITSYDARPRAINFLKENVPPKRHFYRPGATESGVPVIFYSPALIENALTLDLSIVFDQFPKEAFTKVGDALNTAASIPMFITANIYLLAAGAISKLVGQAGESLFDGKPCFSVSEPLNIHWPGTKPRQIGFALLTDGTADANFRKTYQVNSLGEVVDKDGNKYDGDIPYIVISIDGTEQPELADFTPTAASSAILSRFYGVKDGQSQPIDQLIEAMKVYNDLRYRQDIDRLDKTIAATTNPEKLAELKGKREALTKNIITDIMKLS